MLQDCLGIQPWPFSLLTCLSHEFSLQQVAASSSAMHTVTGQQLPAEQLEIGSLITVKPGDGMPTDGIVVSGAFRIDESMLMGEPAPVSKKADDKVSQHSGHHGCITSL